MSTFYRPPRVNMFWSATDAAKAPDQSPPDSNVEWLPVRRSRPLNQLLPATRRWAEALPGIAPPANLLRDFPRIANRIAHDWHDADAARALFDDLLIDRRGRRRGFPPLVLAELLDLNAALEDAHRKMLGR